MKTKHPASVLGGHAADEKRIGGMESVWRTACNIVTPTARGRG
jgi:hypothetical protein